MHIKQCKWLRLKNSDMGLVFLRKKRKSKRENDKSETQEEPTRELHIKTSHHSMGKKQVTLTVNFSVKYALSTRPGDC